MEKEKQNPFEKYMGIGNPGIGKGKEAIQRWLREMRDGVDAKPPKKRKRRKAKGSANRKLR
jgi:transposase